MRLRDLIRQASKQSRLTPSGQWFGFQAPEHSYDPPNIRFDPFNRDAWRWFCVMQFTPTEVNEYAAEQVWQDAHSYPGSAHGDSPELVHEAEQFRKRRIQLEREAQRRAEELDAEDPDHFIDWKLFYHEVQKIEEKQPESPSEATVDPNVSPMRAYWNWRLQVMELYRKHDAENQLLKQPGES